MALTSDGGSYDGGVLYEYDPSNGSYIKKIEFNYPNGITPCGSLTVGASGKLYGLTSNGGSSNSGVLFEFDQLTGTYTKRIDFNVIAPGTRPLGSLTLTSNGKLYGMTSAGGANNFGTIFEFDPVSGSYVKRQDLPGIAVGDLIQSVNGKLYGMTQTGGTYSQGVLFEYDISSGAYNKKLDFDGTMLGGSPLGSLLEASNGKFYGTTFVGGANGMGILFEFDPNSGVLTDKIDFSSSTGYQPRGGRLIQLSNGRLYGMTSAGGGTGAGGGVIFEYDPTSGTYTSKVVLTQTRFLFPWGNGLSPWGSLMQASNGKLYGVTNSGGNEYHGVLFEIDPASWVYTKKLEFAAATEGARPKGSLVLASNGKFYGMTSEGGANGYGVLFEFDPSNGNYASKFNFDNTNGAAPTGSLVQANNGKLYGMTSWGGAGGSQGVLFEYDPNSGTLTKKIDFNTSPRGNLVQSSNGKLYGLTSSPSVLFEYNTSTGQIANKIYFSAAGLGSTDAVGYLTEAPNGKLYGVCRSGGANNKGILFEYDPTTITILNKLDFDGANNGSFPSGPLTLASNGKLYGMTQYGGGSGGGVLFEFDPTAAAYVKKIDLVGGSYPQGGLVETPNHKLYGVTAYGSTISAQGTLFEYDLSNGSFTKKIDFIGPNGATPVFTSLVYTASNQSITFDPLSSKVYGDIPFNLTATASSGLQVSYSSSNTSVATVSGSTVTIVGAGSTVITATQGGDINYYPATGIQQTLTVNKANQTITFNSLAAKNYGDAPYNLTANGGASGNQVTYTSSNPAVATVSGNIVTIVGVGTTTITASQAGNANYNAATDVAQTLTVNKGNQIITFGALAAKNYGDAQFTLGATSTSGLTVSYTSSNTAVATVSGNTATLVGAGTTTITASQSGDTNYNAATNIQQTLIVNKANQIITFGALAAKNYGDAPFGLTATASSGLPMSYTSSNTAVATVSGSTVTIVGAGSTVITASQVGNTNYNAATNVTQTLTVNKINQTITFGALGAKNYGDAPFALTATASSGLGVSYTSSNTAVATVSGSSVTIVGAGTSVITASQAGNTNYNAATNVTQTLTVNKINQTITFGALAAKNYGDAPFTLSATINFRIDDKL